MNSRYNDSDLDETSEDREISLGATSILGIFFALALVCAVCFGVGYATRGHQTPPSPAATLPTVTPAGTSQAKPSPASLEPAAPPDPAALPENAATVSTDAAADQTDSANTAPAPAPKTATAMHASGPATAAAVAKSGVAVVQVAAVSHKQDADFLLAALKKRGYDASIRQEPQDKLLHVQLGPYASKKDATVIRDRLISDGYNPIVK